MDMTWENLVHTGSPSDRMLHKQIQQGRRSRLMAKLQERILSASWPLTHHRRVDAFSVEV